MALRDSPRHPLALAALVFGAVWLSLGLPGCGSADSSLGTDTPESARAATTREYRCRDCNVILISIDTLRADHLGAYGYGRDTSPHLDAFARESVLFEDFVHSGGGTVASHLTMLTSLYPANHGIRGLGDDRVLDPDRVTLAEQLRAANFETAGFTDAGWMKGRFGFAQGFERFDDEGGHLPTILPKVRRWLDENANRRFFLFLHTYDVHSATE